MLRLRTKLMTSLIPNAGLGLFSAEPISKGTVIWFFEEGFDLLLPLDLVAKRYAEDALFRELLPRVAYIRPSDPQNFLFVLDDSRFMNHAQNPNCYVEPDGTVVALYDIEEGIELTCDYDSFAPDPVQDWKPGQGESAGNKARQFSK